ncbi:AraC-like DNA-binding protein [Paraburkholderia youngii]|uniref:TnsD family Tn7-like transposition protein n=1 Tax=Paraburkholderia youngii TaxID=2782701 RepID=UPI003D1DF41E
MLNPFRDDEQPYSRVEIHEGETVPSFLRQVALLSGFRSDYWVIYAAMGRRGPPLEAMPAPIRAVSERFPVLGSVDELLESAHMLYRYWTLCTDEIARRRVRDILTDATPGPLRPCHLPVDLEPSPHDLLHCPECDQVNAKEFGYSPTLTIHLAPYVSVCPRHEACILAAKQGGLFANTCTVTNDRARLVRSLDYSRRVEGILHANSEADKLKEDFKILLNERGFATPSGRFRWDEFLDAHCSFHSTPFADARLTAVCQDKKLLRNALAGWLNGRRSLHPVIFCLATWSLSEVSCDSTIRVKSKSQSRHRLEASAVVDAVTRAPTLTSAAELLGVSVTTLATRASELGLPVNRKPSVLHLDCREVIQAAFDLSLSISEIAAQVGVSVSTVYRVIRVSGQFDCRRTLSAHAREMRDIDEWMQLESERPNSSVCDLRKQRPALFARLYRCGHSFSNRRSMPHGARPNSGSELRKARTRPCGRNLNRAICDAQLANGFSRSPRLSERRVAKLTGISVYSLKTCSSSVRKTLEAVIETDKGFVERRVREAWAEMTTPELPCRRWEALRHSGIRLFRHRL